MYTDQTYTSPTPTTTSTSTSTSTSTTLSVTHAAILSNANKQQRAVKCPNCYHVFSITIGGTGKHLTIRNE